MCRPSSNILRYTTTVEYILCVADSQTALRGILPTKPLSGQFRAILYDRLGREALRLRSRPHLTILNIWTSAHINTLGNEMSDLAAKEAMVKGVDPDNYVSLTYVRRHIHLQVLGAWGARWNSTKTGKAFRAVDPSLPSLVPISLYPSSSLSRTTSSQIFQLRTGFSFLNALKQAETFSSTNLRQRVFG